MERETIGNVAFFGPGTRCLLAKYPVLLEMIDVCYRMVAPGIPHNRLQLVLGSCRYGRRRPSNVE